MKEKKGVSPIITTIILVLLAIVLASIVLLYFTAFTNERVSKFVSGEEMPVDQACSKVNLKVSLSGNDLSVINQGDVAVYRIAASITGEGSTSTVEFSELNFPAGDSKIITDSRLGSSQSLKIIPILLGTAADKSTKEYQCPKINWISP